MGGEVGHKRAGMLSAAAGAPGEGAAGHRGGHAGHDQPPGRAFEAAFGPGISRVRVEHEGFALRGKLGRELACQDPALSPASRRLCPRRGAQPSLARRGGAVRGLCSHMKSSDEVFRPVEEGGRREGVCPGAEWGGTAAAVPPTSLENGRRSGTDRGACGHPPPRAPSSCLQLPLRVSPAGRFGPRRPRQKRGGTGGTGLLPRATEPGPALSPAQLQSGNHRSGIKRGGKKRKGKKKKTKTIPFSSR